MRDLPVAKSVFPDVDYAPIAEAFGFQAATVRTLDDLQKLAPLLARPDGPLFPRLQAERRRRRAVHERVPRVLKALKRASRALVLAGGSAF